MRSCETWYCSALAGALGRRCAPELVDEPVCGDDLVGTGEQECEKCPLPRAAEREGTALLDDLERSQDAELHVLSSSGSFCSSAATLTPVVSSAEAQRRLSAGVDHSFRPPAAA